MMLGPSNSFRKRECIITLKKSFFGMGSQMEKSLFVYFHSLPKASLFCLKARLVFHVSSEKRRLAKFFYFRFWLKNGGGEGGYHVLLMFERVFIWYPNEQTITLFFEFFQCAEQSLFSVLPYHHNNVRIRFETLLEGRLGIDDFWL